MSKEKLGIKSLLIALLATFVCFIPVLDNDFVNWDDHLYVLRNWMVKDISISQCIEVFKTPQVVGAYYPLTIISLGIDYALGNGSPLPFHITNLTLHLLSVMLVFWLIKLLTKRVEAAFICALLFGIHPMHVEPVAWISSRKDVLYGFFFLLALVTHVYYITKGKKLFFYVLTFICFLLSLLSKGVAVVLPIVLLLMDYLCHRNDYWKIVLEKVPLFILSVGVGLFAVQSQQQGDAMLDLSQYPIYHTFFIANYNFLWYLVTFFFPYKLAAFHPYPFLNVSDIQWYFYASIIPVIILLVLFYKYGRKSRPFVFGIGFFLVSIAPVLKILPFGVGIVSERYTYISYLGLFYLLVIAFLKIRDGEWKVPHWVRSITFMSGILWLAIFGVMSYVRADVWQNGETLWTDVTKKYPNNYFAYNSLGDYWQLQGEYEKSLEPLNRSIALNPNYSVSYNHRGKAYQNLGEFQLAFYDFNKAIELDNTYHKAYLGRAIMYVNLDNDTLNAWKDINRALTLEPNYSLGYLNRAVIYEMKGMYDKAEEDYTMAINLEPDNARNYRYRGLLYYNQGHLQEAMKDYNRALYYNPEYGNVYFLRSWIYRDRNKDDLAKQDALKARELGFPVDDEYIENLND